MLITVSKRTLFAPRQVDLKKILFFTNPLVDSTSNQAGRIFIKKKSARNEIYPNKRTKLYHQVAHNRLEIRVQVRFIEPLSVIKRSMN